MSGRLNKKLEMRKRAYEARKRFRISVLEARRARYEEERETLTGVGIGISSIRRRLAVPKMPITRPYRGARVETVKPDLTLPRESLVDVFDKDNHLLIVAELTGIPLPEDVTIDEISEISFHRGVLEIKLRKRKEELMEKEMKVWKEGEAEKITAKVKQKIQLRLKGIKAAHRSQGGKRLKKYARATLEGKRREPKEKA